MSYIFRAFAHHLSAIQGSWLKEEDDLPACGALALAATAVSGRWIPAVLKGYL